MPKRPPIHRPPSWRPPAEQKREADKRRGHSAARGYGGHWRKLRLVVLARETECRMCKARGHVTPAAEVDHIDGNSANNHDSNLRPLCKPCHSARTAKDQAFGRKP